MSIDSFLKRGVLIQQESSKEEIEALLKIVERDLHDSKASEVSYDWQFGIAYNAALKLATILVRCAGYRVKGQGHHMNTIALIPEFLGKDKKEFSDYLDTCRRKRNIVEYECAGGATKEDVLELSEFAVEFQSNVLDYLEKNS